MADPRLASILDRSGDPATVAWAHEGVGALAGLADPELAIAAAVALGNVAALQSVEEPKALRKLAAAGLHKLKSRGVSVEAKLAPKAFSLGREVLDVPPRAVLGGPNELGNFHMVLTATDHEGSCIMELIVGGDKVQDQHGHASRHELRSFWKDMESDRSLREVPFVAGLHFADKYAAGRNLHGWGHFLGKVPPAALVAARAVNPLTHALADDGNAPGGWILPAWIVPGKTVDVLATGLSDPEAGPDGMAPEAVEAVIDEALTPELVAQFAAAAEANVAFFRMLGYANLAGEAEDVAAKLRASEGSKGIPQLRAAVLIAAFQELNHRQQEKQREIDDMMRMIGQQQGE